MVNENAKFGLKSVKYSEKTNSFGLICFPEGMKDSIWVTCSEAVHKFATGKEGKYFNVLEMDGKIISKIRFIDDKPVVEGKLEAPEKLALMKVAAQLRLSGEYEGKTFREVLKDVTGIYNE